MRHLSNRPLFPLVRFPEFSTTRVLPCLSTFATCKGSQTTFPRRRRPSKEFNVPGFRFCQTFGGKIIRFRNSDQNGNMLFAHFAVTSMSDRGRRQSREDSSAKRRSIPLSAVLCSQPTIAHAQQRIARDASGHLRRRRTVGVFLSASRCDSKGESPDRPDHSGV